MARSVKQIAMAFIGAELAGLRISSLFAGFSLALLAASLIFRLSPGMGPDLGPSSAISWRSSAR